MSGPQAGQSASGFASQPAGSAVAPDVILDTDKLFAEARGNEVRIRHRGQEYRLRITKQGKLILTK